MLTQPVKGRINIKPNENSILNHEEREEGAVKQTGPATASPEALVEHDGGFVVLGHALEQKKEREMGSAKKNLLSNFPVKNAKNHFYGLFLTFELFG